MPGGSDVAGGVDAGRDGLQPLVDQHALSAGDPGRLGQLGARDGTDADQHQIALNDAEHAPALEHLRELARSGTLTLLTATRHAEISQATVVADLIRG